MHLGQAIEPVVAVSLDLIIDISQLLFLLRVQPGHADGADARRQFLAGVQGGDRQMVGAAELDDGPIQLPLETPARLVFRRLQEVGFGQSYRLGNRPGPAGRASGTSPCRRPSRSSRAARDLMICKLNAMMQIAIVGFADADQVGVQ